MSREPTRSVRLDGVIELLAPMSHIGETISTQAYLNEEPVIQPDGTTENVFVYNGNALRGQLRDCAAKYLLTRLGGVKVPLPAFHLLFSGGSIGGPQNVDLAQAREYRRLLPMISLLGGGVGNQILPGKLRVGNSYPIVRQTARLVPKRYQTATLPDYGGWTAEKSFSRTDDAKDERLLPHLRDADVPAALPRAAKGDAPPTQMRYTVELLCAGARLYTHLVALDVTETELGCLVAAFDELARFPFLGGQARMGHGRCRIEYEWTELRAGATPSPFLTVDAESLSLSDPAAEAKDAYDRFLSGLYERYLAENRSELAALLEATA